MIKSLLFIAALLLITTSTFAQVQSSDGPDYSFLDFIFGSSTSNKLARIVAQKTSATGGGGNLYFQTPTGSAASAYSTKLTILRDGFVGIGNEGPETRLHIRGTNHIGYGLLTLQGDATTPNQAYMSFYHNDYSRLGYIGANNGKIEIHNDKTGIVALSPSGTTAKVLVGGATGITNHTFQVHGNAYTKNYLGVGVATPIDINNMLEVAGTVFSSNATKGAGVFISADYGPYGSIEARSNFNTGNRPLIIQGNGGSVGIGSNVIDPSTDLNIKFQVAGGAMALQGGNSFYFYGPNNLFSEMLTDQQQNLTFRAGNGGVIFQSGNPNASIGFKTFFNNEYNERLTIKSNGNIGVGTTDPKSMLAVKGEITATKLKITQTIAATKIKVKQTEWADYVFEASYKLPTLKEVEGFIKQNKHLPDVPSAAEVAKEGLDIGENQAILLKKIEELTLYVIELKKQVDNQNKIIQHQQKYLIDHK